jgi:hypothetical protein
MTTDGCSLKDSMWRRDDAGIEQARALEDLGRCGGRTCAQGEDGDGWRGPVARRGLRGKLRGQGVQAGQDPADSAVPAQHQHAQPRHLRKQPQRRLRLLLWQLHHLQGVEEAQEAPAQLRANLRPAACVQEYLPPHRPTLSPHSSPTRKQHKSSELQMTYRLASIKSNTVLESVS